MKKIELLKVKNDLFWASHFDKGFDKLFHKSGFIDKFVEFLQSDIGKDWFNTEEGIKYSKWQTK